MLENFAGKHDEYERVTAAKRWCESSKSRPEVSRQERLNR